MNHLTCSWKTMQIAKLKEISKLPHIYELLTRSLAPSIWELEDIKKGLLCQVCLAAPDDTLRFCCWAFELFSTSIFGMIFFTNSASSFLQKKFPVAALWWVCQEIVIRGFFPRRHECAIGWWPWNQQISAAPICTQNCTSRHLHQWARKLSCRIDGLCCQGSWDPWNCNLQSYLTVLLWNVLHIMGSAQKSADF